MFTTEFPNYDTSTLPLIPSDWIDTSWHNDVCPSWQFGKYQIFIDHANPNERETGGERYFVNDAESGDCLLITDEWYEVLAYIGGTYEKKRIGINCEDLQSAERIAVAQYANQPKIEKIENGYRVSWKLKTQKFVD